MNRFLSLKINKFYSYFLLYDYSNAIIVMMTLAIFYVYSRLKSGRRFRTHIPTEMKLLVWQLTFKVTDHIYFYLKI